MTDRSIWHVVGASVQGTSHQKVEVPCQDAHGYRLLADNVLLIVVADGAGSADRSAEGAMLAVTKTLDSVEASLNITQPATETRWRKVLFRSFRKARRAIVKLARREEIDSRAFATTLTCVVVSDQWLAVGQIGDGVAIAQAKDGQLFTTVEPQQGEYANETTFLTMDDALAQVEVQIYCQPVQALAVMTDGLIRLAMDLTRQTPHPPFFQPLLAFVTQMTDEAEAQAQLSDFLASERVCARTDDDKTVVLAVRHEFLSD